MSTKYSGFELNLIRMGVIALCVDAPLCRMVALVASWTIPVCSVHRVCHVKGGLLTGALTE